MAKSSDSSPRRRDGISTLPKKQLKVIETLARTDFTQEEIRGLAGYSRLGHLQPPPRDTLHSAEVISAVAGSGEIPEHLLLQYIASYRAGWQQLSDHEVLLNTLKSLYREGARARDEHELKEKIP